MHDCLGQIGDLPMLVWLQCSLDRYLSSQRHLPSFFSLLLHRPVRDVSLAAKKVAW